MPDTKTSSFIESFNYDPATKVLTVDYRTGMSYPYFNVPPGLYQELLNINDTGQSVGTFINTVIKPIYKIGAKKPK